VTSIQDRLVLILPGDSELSDRVLLYARRRGYRRFASPPAARTAPSPGEEWWALDHDGFRAQGTEVARLVPIHTIASPRELEALLAQPHDGGTFALRWKGERVIPLETVVARENRSAGFWVFADAAAQIPAALGALERGAPTVVLAVDSVEEIDLLGDLLEEPKVSPHAELIELVRVESVGMGDRVIVDATSLLGPAEGLWAGSSAAFLFHVVSEAVGSRYTRPRPFRVNAGAAHSYVLLSNGETRYLTELEPGDGVLVGPPRGPFRSVRVGRLKVERRPITLVEGLRDDRRFTVFVQEAETVRLSAESGPVAVTALARGSRVFGAALPSGRHLGLVVDETVEER
jgi:3-dehydroquinate synthase II